MNWKEYQNEVAEIFNSIGAETKIEHTVEGVRGKHKIDIWAKLQKFGSLLGFILADDPKTIKNKIIQKLGNKFDLSPEGDLKFIINRSIEENEFTFDSIHNRFSIDFILHHLLLDFACISIKN